MNGFITVTLGVPSFITTIGTGFVMEGLALTFSHAEPSPTPPSVLSAGKWLGVPGNPWQWAPFVWAVVLVLIFHVVLTGPGSACTHLGRREPARRPGGRHQRGPDQVRQLHDHGLHGGAGRPPDGALHQQRRPERLRVPADVLRRDRRRHRRHGDAGWLGHDPRRVPRRDRAGHPDRRLRHHRRQLEPAADHLRRRDSGRNDRKRAARPAARIGEIG